MKDTVQNMCHCPELDPDSEEWSSNLILMNLDEFPRNPQGGGEKVGLSLLCTLLGQVEGSVTAKARSPWLLSPLSSGSCPSGPASQGGRYVVWPSQVCFMCCESPHQLDVLSDLHSVVHPHGYFYETFACQAQGAGISSHGIQGGQGLPMGE